MFGRMLYEFHSTQNAKKPNSIHATYLVAGRQRKPEHTNGVNARNGDDVDMRSSPFMSSMPEPEEEEPEEEVKETTILLVREEELQSALDVTCRVSMLTMLKTHVPNLKRRLPSTSTAWNLDL